MGSFYPKGVGNEGVGVRVWGVGKKEGVKGEGAKGEVG
jgi:hypothetical protein